MGEVNLVDVLRRQMDMGGKDKTYQSVNIRVLLERFVERTNRTQEQQRIHCLMSSASFIQNVTKDTHHDRNKVTTDLHL